MSVVSTLTLLSLLLTLVTSEHTTSSDCANLTPEMVKEIQSYRPVAEKIIYEIVHGNYSGIVHKRLGYFCDRFGPRSTGTQSLEDAIDYLQFKMNKEGLKSYTEHAQVPIWRRRKEVAQMISPRFADLSILSLGTSVGTPKGGLTAEVVVVESFKELEELDERRVTGKIVVFTQKFVDYFHTREYRLKGANYASRKGAAATLINSVASKSLYTPHTGVLEYDDDVKKIPAACITAEDADMLQRMHNRGTRIRIHLEIEAENFPNFISRNLIGELQGRQFKNTSVVVVSGHLDTWDNTVGAMDDGGGAFISWHAASFLSKMGLKPRRTIRSILFTGEEQGLFGAKAYRENHLKHEQEEFNLLIESDGGTFEPRGLDLSGSKDAECILREVVKLLKPINATEFATPQMQGPDISLWTDVGFPGASLLNKDEHYFEYHHSRADSMLVETKENLDKGTAVFAVAAFVVADLSFDIPKNVQT